MTQVIAILPSALRRRLLTAYILFAREECIAKCRGKLSKEAYLYMVRSTKVVQLLNSTG